MRLRCVVTLTMLTLLVLCKAAKVAARVSGAKELQIHGVDTLPRTNHFRVRRWPARLLATGPITSFLNFLKRTAAGEWVDPVIYLKRASDRKDAVTFLFNHHKLGSVDINTFFLSTKFRTWERQVTEAYGAEADQLMLASIREGFRYNGKGRVEAIIAQAIENNNARDVAFRFENELLQNLVEGMKAERFPQEMDFVRYALYRGADRGDVISKMQRLMDIEMNQQEWFSNLEKRFLPEKESQFEQLRSYFIMVSGGRTITFTFKTLGALEGFNNDAFMLSLLYNKATDKDVQVDFVEFMFHALDHEKLSIAEISDILLKLKSQKLPYDLHAKLLNPMSEAI